MFAGQLTACPGPNIYVLFIYLSDPELKLKYSVSINIYDLLFMKWSNVL